MLRISRLQLVRRHILLTIAPILYGQAEVERSLLLEGGN